MLNSAFSVNSVSGFYAIGGTRIKLLDILLLLAIFGGLGIAIGHVFLAGCSSASASITRTTGMAIRRMAATRPKPA